MKRVLPALFAIFVAVCASGPGVAQSGGAGQALSRDPTAPLGGGQQNQNQDNGQAEEKTELDLPLDEAIKLRVEPVVASNVVDRVVEDATVFVNCPGAIAVRVFLVPVDSPYGGKAIGKPRLIGKTSKPGREFTVRWVGKEEAPYVKLFAVVRERAQPDQEFRSRTIDLAVGRARLQSRQQSKPAP